MQVTILSTGQGEVDFSDYAAARHLPTAAGIRIEIQFDRSNAPPTALISDYGFESHAFFRRYQVALEMPSTSHGAASAVDPDRRD